MDCEAKDGLIIFLLILSGILAAIVIGALIYFCRKKVPYSHCQSIWSTFHSPFGIHSPTFMNVLIVDLTKISQRWYLSPCVQSLFYTLLFHKHFLVVLLIHQYGEHDEWWWWWWWLYWSASSLSSSSSSCVAKIDRMFTTTKSNKFHIRPSIEPSVNYFRAVKIFVII